MSLLSGLKRGREAAGLSASAIPARPPIPHTAGVPSTPEPVTLSTAPPAVLNPDSVLLDPAARAFFEANSGLWAALGKDDPDATWETSMPPAVPLARCAEELIRLHQLSTETYTLVRLLRIRHEASLFPCLGTIDDAGLGELLQLAEYVQLPKAVVFKLETETVARALRGAPLASLAAAPGFDAAYGACEYKLSVRAVVSIATAALAGSAQRADQVLAALAAEIGACIKRGVDYGLPAHHKTAALRSLWGVPLNELSACRDDYPAYLFGLLHSGRAIPALDRSKPLSVPEFVMAAAAETGRQQDMIALRLRGAVCGPTAMRVAASKGAIPVLVLLEQFACTWDARACAAAAGGGHLEALKWLRAQGVPWDATTCRSAASSGHVHVLAWARENRCPWDRATTSSAAAAGQLAALQWCLANGAEVSNPQICAFAVQHGHADVLRWAVGAGCPLPSSVAGIALSAHDGAMLRLVKELGCPMPADGLVQAANSMPQGGPARMAFVQLAADLGCPANAGLAVVAARAGDDALLRLAHTLGCPVSDQVCPQAAAARRWGTVRLAVELGHPLSEAVMSKAAEAQQADLLKFCVDRGIAAAGLPAASAAASTGDLALLQWLHGKGVAMTSPSLCTAAAGKGKRAVLQYLHAAGSPLSEGAAAAAAGRGHLAALHWLLAQTPPCPVDPSVCAAAAGHNQLPVLRWLRKRECPWDESACEAAAAAGHRDVLKWLRKHGCPAGVRTTAAAARAGKAALLKSLHKAGVPWDETCTAALRDYEHEDLLDWAIDHGCPDNEESEDDDSEDNEDEDDEDGEEGADFGRATFSGASFGFF